MKVEKIENNKLRISDLDTGIDCVFFNGRISGKGSRKYNSDIREAISEFNLNEINSVVQKTNEIYNSSTDDYRELASLSFLIDSLSENIDSPTVSMKEIIKWTKNPIKYSKNLYNYSLFLYGENSIVSRSYDLFTNVHSLNSSLKISNPDDENLIDDLKEIKRYDSYINKETVIRDILREVVHGTCIGFIHRKRYLQILDFEIYTPTNLVDGYWEVVVDLLKLTTADENKTIYEYPNEYQPEKYKPKKEVIDRQPEIVRQAFGKWQRGGKQRYFKLPVEMTIVIKHDSLQQERYGRPYAMPAMKSILHKEMLTMAEQVLIDKLINSVYVLTMGEKGKEQDGAYKPNSSQRRTVGSATKDALNKKSDSSNVSSRIIGLPWWASLDALEIDKSIFSPDKFEEVSNDIRIALGVGEIFGVQDSGSYASASISIDLFMKNVLNVLAQIEDQLFNRQYQLMTTNRNNIFTRKFSRGTVVIGDERIEVLKQLMNYGGSIKAVLDELGLDYDEYIKQVKKEKDVDKLHDLFEPFRTSSTLSNDEGGRPSEGGDGDGNDNPKPSTS